MTACERCGHEYRPGARFCDACGAPLEHAAPERRKLATMLFCDMSGSTALGERVDAESVREMMFAYFHEMRGAIERHGGTVEKFIGDAVMAVFGVPTAHEDDALRGCRAAHEMQERLGSLNDALEQRFGSRIALRIGVNTGEVVAGHATARQALVTGDAVNVAARLEQAAAPGEILIGKPTYDLVRDAVSVEPVEPLALKGKSEPLPAYRLTHVEPRATARARRLDTPLVGRQPELEALRAVLAEAKAGTTRLATVVGEPGVGKSRLAAELLAQAQRDFQILTGRCLQYGEGITYWALTEIVRQAAGIRDEHSREEALGRLESVAPGPETQAVAEAIGLAEGGASMQEIAAAFHALFTALAARRPLLLVVDDVHWAEPALLDLLRGLPVVPEAASLLVLCLARPELLEKDDAWEATVRLQPLEPEDAATLVEQLLGEAELPAELAERISSAAAGNPLFVEELVGMLVDEGLLARRDGSWVADSALAGFTIPPTLRELLGARLDRLPRDERAALERGAVEGQVFHSGAVAALSDEDARPALVERLLALAEREYLRAARADFVDESAYRVRHILIRDAAYEGIPKRLRASLHEHFADWLEGKAGDRAGEYEEILGFHLEQAFKYRSELAPVDEESRAVALRAADKLEHAGRRALDRRDSPASINLLSRAADLLPDGERAAELRLFVGEELGYLMELEHSGAVLTDVRDRAQALGNRKLEGRARLFGGLMRYWADPEFGVEEFLREIDEVAAAAGAEESVSARAHDARSFVFVQMGRFDEARIEAEQAVERYRRLSDRRSQVEQYWFLGWAAAYGPETVVEGIRLCREIMHEAGDDPAVEGHTLYSLAVLESLRGRIDEARELAERGRSVFERTGMVFTLWYFPHLGSIEVLAGNAAAAEHALRTGCTELEAVNDFPSVTHAAGLLADLLVDQERVDEADEWSARARDCAPKDQPPHHARWRAARARVLARQGDAGAEELAREAVALAGRTDFLVLQGDSFRALADVLATQGDTAGAGDALESALDRYERKGADVLAARTRALLGAGS